ncbi:hypothetical protein B296_00047893, partial [Ensete ventricosum]
ELNSSTNPGDLAENVNSGTNPEDLAEKVNSGTNPGDLAKKVNSSTNSRDLGKRVNSGTNPGDLAEKVNLSTNSGDLAERVNSGTNPGNLTERVRSSLPQVGGASQDDPEANSSGVSSGPLSLVDARVLRDLEVMKADHDLDTTVTEGSLAVIRGRYSIPAEYGFHVPRPGQCPYSSDVRPTYRMDLGDLRMIPKMSSGKAPSTRATTPAREVSISPAREAPKASSKRPIDAPTEQADDSAQRHKRVKVLMRRHKSRHGEGESRSHSKGKEPAAPSEEPFMPVGSDEGDTSPVHRRPRSMKDLFKTKFHKGNVGYYTLQMSDLGYQDPDKEMKARWRGLKNSMKVWNDSSAAEEFKRGLLHPQLARGYTCSLQRLTRAELPRQAVDCYKESAGFKEGLKRMGRVSYEYGYWVALACIHSLHPDSEVEEDPFTIHPEDDLVPMERQQAFEDSDPLES